MWNRKLTPTQIRDLILILYNSVEHGPWRAGNLSVTEGIPSLLQNPRAHCRVHNSLPLGPIKDRIFQFTPSHPISVSTILVLSFHPQLCHPCRPCFAGSLHLRIMYAFYLTPITAACSAWLSVFLWCSHPLNISARLQIMKPFIMQFYTVFCYFFPFGFKYFS